MRKIMVVEDNPVDHSMLRDFLVTQGYEVNSVHDANIVYEQIERQKPEMIFIALMLNDFITGKEIVEKLKIDSEFHTPIVGMSAQVNADADYFYRLCDYQLAKPISISNISKITSKVFADV